MTTLTSNELLHRPFSPNLGNVLYTASGKNFTAVILPNTTPTDEGHKVSSQVLHLIASLIKGHWEPISCDEHNFDNISTAWVINLSHSPLQSPQGIISFRFRISLYFAGSKHCLFEHSKATSCHESVYWASQTAPAAPTRDWSPAEYSSKLSIKCLSVHYLQIFTKKRKILQKTSWVIIMLNTLGRNA